MDCDMESIIKHNRELMDKKYLLNKLLENDNIKSTLNKILETKSEGIDDDDKYMLEILKKNNFNVDNTIQSYIIDKCFKQKDRESIEESIKETKKLLI